MRGRLSTLLFPRLGRRLLQGLLGYVSHRWARRRVAQRLAALQDAEQRLAALEQKRKSRGTSSS